MRVCRAENLVESIAISKWRNNASIKTWLSESIKTVDIGGGCRSANAQIPYSHILFGAASVGTTILLWLKGDKFPGKGEAHPIRPRRDPGVDHVVAELLVEELAALPEALV